MSKMAEMAQTIEELRTAAASINAAADWLYQQFSGDNNSTQEPAKAPVKKEVKPQLKLEDVRAVLAEKSRAGHTAEVRALLKKYCAAKLSEIDPANYEALMNDAEVIGNKILRNEKYMGDALLQKTYTTDFLTKKRIKNNGAVPQYYVEGDHEAIIPKELFMQVQAELVRRRVVHVSPTGKKRSFSCNHCFAQMIFCGDCGELYRRVHWNNHGCKSIVWRCISRLEPTSAEKNCTNRTVNELLLQEITVKSFNQILSERDFFLKTLQQNIAKAMVNADHSHRTAFRQGLRNCKKSSSRRRTINRITMLSPMRFSGSATRRNSPRSTAITEKKP